MLLLLNKLGVAVPYLVSLSNLEGKLRELPIIMAGVVCTFVRHVKRASKLQTIQASG